MRESPPRRVLEGAYRVFGTHKALLQSHQDAAKVWGKTMVAIVSTDGHIQASASTYVLARVDSSHTVKIEGGKVTVTSSGSSVEVSDGAVTVAKGSSTMRVDDSGVTISGTDVTITATNVTITGSSGVKINC